MLKLEETSLVLVVSLYLGWIKKCKKFYKKSIDRHKNDLILNVYNEFPAGLRFR